MPYPSTEPKTETAKARILKTKAHEDASSQFPASLLEQAVEEISRSLNGGWCLERKILASEAQRQSQKSKAREKEAQVNRSVSAHLARHSRNFYSQSKEEPGLSSGGFHEPIDLSGLTNCSSGNACSYVQQLVNRSFSNPRSYPLFLQHAKSRAPLTDTYMIPPHASFVLSKINQNTTPAMSMAALTMYPEPSATASRGQFDFILLDPPWENRSVRRAARYDTMREPRPLEALQSMLGQHIAPGGTAACWITNKASVRHTALEWFEDWDIEVIEEWAWLKVTTNGTPVTEINGLWRKPYEILLVGKKRDQAIEKTGGNLVRRVIVGVPDVHSRKPNLKALIEPVMPAPYRALEIFARNLTAGWCAWGDEVLNYAVVQ